MNYYKFHFSPTGGTKKVADAVAEGWGQSFQSVDLMMPVPHMQLRSDDICLFAVPSYGGRVPSVVIERFAQLFGNGARAILIAVFGNRAIDDTLLELSDELQKAGFRCIAGIEAVAQHSLLPKYGAGRPDEADVKELKEFAQKIKDAVEQDQLSPQLKLPGNRPYQKYNGVPLVPSVIDGCIACQICAQQCPTGAIPMMRPKSTDVSKCISCMRCVQVCPKHVRKLSKLMVFGATQIMKKSCSGRKDNKLYL